VTKRGIIEGFTNMYNTARQEKIFFRSLRIAGPEVTICQPVPVLQ